MVVVQLMASPFFGGPERQVVGLAQSLPANVRTVFLTFAENGGCHALLDELAKRGLNGKALEKNYPDIPGAVREMVRHLRELRADIVCCNGYKPDIIGLLAARQAGIPVVSISHGWTSATWKVRLNETMDRMALAWMDATVCVSKAQAVKVRQAGVPPERVVVIRNAINADEIAGFEPAARASLEAYFETRPRWLVGAAGRLSREKGMEQFVAAATYVLARTPDAGFIIFGEGPERKNLERLIFQQGLQGKLVLAGFREDVGKLLACLDVSVLSSWTEGLPVVVLEALAAGVPVVATAVGGTPEVIDDGVNGFLVPPGDPAALAQRISELLNDDNLRRAMGERGRRRVRKEFTFAQQADAYVRLFEKLVKQPAGSAWKRIAEEALPPWSATREAEPRMQWIPRQSLGTR